eukprot:480363_1
MLARSRSLISHNITIIAKRSSVAKLTKSIDFNDSSVQLIDENESLNYKLYFQQGLSTTNCMEEYNEFNNKIWYGRLGEELCFKMKGQSEDTKHCDLFLMRDYHNNNIIGCNSIKRLSHPKLSMLLNTNICNGNPFNYVIRRTTAICPTMQGKGYGKIIRSYSKYLDDLHVNNYGISMTDVQIKNIPSFNLQISSGFQVVAKADTFMYYRGNYNIPNNIISNYDIYKIDGITEQHKNEFTKITAIHRTYLKRYNFIDLSVYSNEIDPIQPLYIIKPKNSEDILAVIQSKLFTIQIKSASQIETYFMNIMAKFINGFDGQEKNFDMAALCALYGDYDNNNHDMVECMNALITYCLMDNNVYFGTTFSDIRSPFTKFVNSNQRKLCGMVGSIMSEKGMLNILMKFTGLNDQQTNIIKSNPVIVKFPLLLA